MHSLSHPKATVLGPLFSEEQVTWQRKNTLSAITCYAGFRVGTEYVYTVLHLVSMHYLTRKVILTLSLHPHFTDRKLRSREDEKQR